MENGIDKLAIDKASALVEALGYIQRFHNKVVVVKVGGNSTVISAVAVWEVFALAVACRVTLSDAPRFEGAV